MTFKELNIIEPILNAIKLAGYEEPSPIQEQAIPMLLQGSDMLGSAQTGTGKTAAFAIPILQGLYESSLQVKRNMQLKALILTPTRELATQIKNSFQTYGKNIHLKVAVIFGGVSQKSQVETLKKGVDILIATPGRLLDLIDQKLINLSTIKYFVLDEADRMLDMGFIHDVNKIIKLLPQIRQTMLFSATMPKEIVNLANAILHDPLRVQVTPVETTLEVIKQFLYYVNKKEKSKLLIDLLKDNKIKSALVFTRTKHGADKIVKELHLSRINAEVIHGNKSQNARERALSNFKSKASRILVATDIAARGIDISELSHVINFDLPEVPETYIHRIGRTGRAGFSGVAISFCSEDEGLILRDIEKHIKMKITVLEIPNYHFNGLTMEKKSNKEKPIQVRKDGTAIKVFDKSKKGYQEKSIGKPKRNWNNKGSKNWKSKQDYSKNKDK